MPVRRSSFPLFFIITPLLVAAAVLLRRYSGKAPDDAVYGYVFDVLRSLIYIGLLMAWYFSIRRRIMQPLARRCLCALALLLLFWYVARTCKYMIFFNGTVPARYAWYSFHIALNLVPLLAFFVSLCLDRPEDYRLPLPVRLLWIPSLLLVALFLTNDLHQWVFVFPGTGPWCSESYTYGPVYLIATILEIFYSLTALIIIFKKAAGRRHGWIPFLALGCIFLYAALYVLRVPFVYAISGDITSTFCLIIMLIFESCIQCGLIQVNTHYDELFDCSTLSAQITDRDFRPRYISSAAGTCSAEFLRRTVQAPVMAGGIRTSAAPVRGGYIFWQEDISALADVQDQLEENQNALQDHNLLLQEEYRTRSRLQHLEEQNRLYDVIQVQTAPQIDLLGRLLEQLHQCSSAECTRKILTKITVIGAWLKRRINLIFIADRTEVLPVGELQQCLQESACSLTLYGADCSFQLDLEKPLAAEHTMEIYDFFESVVELSLDTLQSLLLRVYRREGMLCARLVLECGADLSSLAREHLSVLQDEDGAWCLLLQIEEGGAA